MEAAAAGVMHSFFQKYLLPGLVFQSVIIGGGYGTGREIAEFFLKHGPVGGLLGMGVAALGWGLVLALAFEFARITKSYDYRAFFTALLGPFWRAFEVIYLAIAVLVLSVLGSASGAMLSSTIGAPPITGALLLLGAVGLLAYFGGKVVEGALAYWTILLSVAYAVFLIWVAATHGGAIADVLNSGGIAGAWHIDGLRYAAYNLIALGAVLFVLPYLETRKEAITSGFVAGTLGILPGVFIFLAMLALYPGIQQEPVPVLSLLSALNTLWFYLIFQIVLFGTFIDTGVGIVHAVNQRVESALVERKRALPHWARLAIAVGLLGSAIFLARAVGIIDLIAKGYGALSYAFIAVVVAPLATIGLFRILNFRSVLAEAT